MAAARAKYPALLVSGIHYCHSLAEPILGMQGLRPAILAGIDTLLEDIVAAQTNRSASASRSLLWMETSMDAASGNQVRATVTTHSGCTAAVSRRVCRTWKVSCPTFA